MVAAARCAAARSRQEAPCGRGMRGVAGRGPARRRLGRAAAAAAPDASAGGGEGAAGDIPCGEALAFAVPTAVCCLAPAVMSAVDTAFVGTCSGVLDLAAMGPAVMVADLTAIALGWHSGATLNYGLRAPNDAARRRVFSASLAIAAMMGVGVMVWHLCAAESLVGAFRPSPELVPAAAEYVRVRAWGLPLLCLSNAFYGMCAARKDAVTPMLVAGVSCAVNGIGDWLCVRVWGMGVGGAAWATMLSQAFAPLAYLCIRSLRRDLQGLRWPARADFAPFARFAAPVLFVTLSTLSMFAVQQWYASQLGVQLAAAHKVAVGVFAVAAFLGDPLSLTAQAYLPGLIKRADGSARRFALWLCGASAAMGAVAGLAITLCLTVFGASFSADAEVRVLAAAVVPQAVLSVVVMLPARALNGAAVACGDLLFYAGATAVNALGFAVALGALHAVGGQGAQGLGGMWWGTVLFYALGLVQFALRLLARRRSPLSAGAGVRRVAAAASASGA